MPEITQPRARGAVTPGSGASQVAAAMQSAALEAAFHRWTPPPEQRPGVPRSRTAAIVVAMCLVAASLSFGLARATGAAPEPSAAAESLITQGTDAASTAGPVEAAVAPAPAVMPGPGVLPAGFSYWSGTVTGAKVTPRMSPSPDAEVVAAFADVNEFGDPQTFRVVGEAWGLDGAPWLHILLPIRPNGSEGWLPAATLTVEGRAQRLEIHRSTSTMSLVEDGRVSRSWRVAVGPDHYPTTLGTTYVWTKYRGGPAGAYGPGVLGLSLFSEVLDASNWPGDARIGIHGAASPDQLGGRAGHGCVRMLNADVAPLLDTLPLGTPVDILE